MPPITSLGSVGKGAGGLIISPKKRIITPAVIASGGGYSPTIPTNNLYSHWDFSRLTDAVGTQYSNSTQTIPNAVGTSIGAVATTPQMYYRYTNYYGGHYATVQNTYTSTGLKAIYLPLMSVGAVNYGGFLESGGGGFPDITSSSFSYTWIAVFKHYGVNGWNRPYRWYLNAYNYDFNHGLWWLNNSNAEIDAINYNASQRYSVNSAPSSDRSNSTYVHYEAVTVTGINYGATWSMNNGNFNTLTSSFSGTPFTGTVNSSTRVFQVRPTNYQFNTYYPGILACEFAFYNRSMDATERSTVLTALKAKWGST